MLLEYYGGSLFQLLKTCYPQYPWKIWRFKVPDNYWKQKEKQKEFLEDLGADLQIGDENWEDWYRVNVQTIREHGGGSLIDMYNGSVADLISSNFPQRNWEMEMFKKAESIFHNLSERVEFIKTIGNRLGVKQWEDWYEVNSGQFREKGGGLLLRHSNENYVDLFDPNVPRASLDDLEVQKCAEWLLE